MNGNKERETKRYMVVTTLSKSKTLEGESVSPTTLLYVIYFKDYTLNIYSLSVLFSNPLQFNPITVLLYFTLIKS